jgi:mannose/fructose/N-acetylgalactosamine-specific phosphotransferase system component IIB
LTFEEFLETLYRHYKKDEKINIGHHRNVSKSVIEKIIKSTEPKGTELEASDLYDLIYTIKMSYYRDDKRNLFKIIESEEKCKELFDKLQRKSRVTKLDYDKFKKYYNEYLKTFLSEKTQKDIADICWEVFEALNTQESDGKWILLVDEVQDFRPMELELIIKVAQKNSSYCNHIFDHKPQTQIAFFGDKNQQILFSDFLWSEIDKIAIDDDKQIFSLSHNFRNTVQIATVDEPLFKLASEQDTINWSMAKIEGPKPVLIIWDTIEDGLKWLKKVFSINNIPIGVGILAESEKAIFAIKEILDEEIYFIARTYEGKGLEFDDLIIVDLFAKLRDLHSNDIEKSVRDLWHVAISRARNNLLVCATRDNLEKLQNLRKMDYEQFIEGFNCYANPTEWEKGFKEFLENCNHTISRLYRILIDLGKSDLTWEHFEKSGKDEDKYKAISTFLKVGRLNEIFKKLEEYYFNNPNKLDVVLDLLAIAFLKTYDNQDNDAEFSDRNNFNETAVELLNVFLNQKRLKNDSEKARYMLTYYYQAPYLEIKTGEFYHRKLGNYAQFIYQLCTLQHPFFDVLTFEAFENSISLALPVEDFFELTVTRILIKSEEFKDYMRVD